MKGVLLSPGVVRHLLIVGSVLFVAGSVTLWLLPELSVWWVVVAVVVVAHVGLLMVVGGSVLRWLAGRQRG